MKEAKSRITPLGGVAETIHIYRAAQRLQADAFAKEAFGWFADRLRLDQAVTVTSLRGATWVDAHFWGIDDPRALMESHERVRHLDVRLVARVRRRIHVRSHVLEPRGTAPGNGRRVSRAARQPGEAVRRREHVPPIPDAALRLVRVDDARLVSSARRGSGVSAQVRRVHGGRRGRGCVRSSRRAAHGERRRDGRSAPVVDAEAGCDDGRPAQLPRDGRGGLRAAGASLTTARGARRLREVDPPQGEKADCAACGNHLEILPGAKRCVCDKCGQALDASGERLTCRGCGAPLAPREGTTNVTCPHCKNSFQRVQMMKPG